MPSLALLVLSFSIALCFSVLNDGHLLESFSVNAVSQETSKYRKRISLKVFPRQEDHLFDDRKKTKMEEKFFVHGEENVSKISFLLLKDCDS